MAFPAVSAADTNTGYQTSNATAWTGGYPANVQAGDLLLMFIVCDGNATFTLPAGWVGGARGATAVTMAWWKKKAVGTETGAFAMTCSASEQGCWRSIRIPSALWEGTLGTSFNSNDATGGSCLCAGTNPTGTTNIPDPPSLDPFNWAAEDTLWIALFGNDGTPTCNVFPTSYTQENHVTAGGVYQTSGGSTGAGFGVAYRQRNISAEDPGTFTMTGAEDWAATTIAVRPAAPSFTPRQAAFRFYEDGTETGSTAIAAQDTNINRLVDSDSNLQLRIRIQETGAVAGVATDDYKIQASKNGGAYADIGSGGVNGYDSASLTEAAATTNRLGAGTGSFVAGKVTEDGTVDDLQITASNYTELVASLTLVAASLAHNNTLDFRFLRNGVALNTYTVTPRITVQKTALTKNLGLLGVG